MSYEIKYKGEQIATVSSEGSGKKKIQFLDNPVDFFEKVKTGKIQWITGYYNERLYAKKWLKSMLPVIVKVGYPDKSKRFWWEFPNLEIPMDEFKKTVEGL